MTEEDAIKGRKLVRQIERLEEEIEKFDRDTELHLMFEGHDYSRYYNRNVTGNTKNILRKIQEAKEAEKVVLETELAAL